MAKNQHGNSYTRKVNSADITDDFKLIMDSSDEDGPEEQTFEDSKTSALQSMKDALASAKREKDLLKEKRRKRQELFQEQKRRKLLPVEILEEIGTAPSKKNELQGLEVSAVSNNEEASCSEEEIEVSEEVTETKLNIKKKIHRLENYSVKVVGADTKANSQQQAALDFIQSRLYGPGVQRMTTNQLLSVQNKRGQNKSAAVQFVNERWGKCILLTW
ncbi:hypothetical protein UPYG_G00299390 [Umbra pygmaea]|uniref:U3 small nucleolar RNA-associated protein NOL7 C-terminal domain-containing protein n=1 Tax=Umbra pygmaea TaxID=75934 RepID=A0ABD0W663_UMBPY